MNKNSLLQGGKRFTDHNAILLNINLPLKGAGQKSIRKTTWNFNDQSGWGRFASLTERDSALTDCWKDSWSVEVSQPSGRKSLIHSCINL